MTKELEAAVDDFAVAVRNYDNEMECGTDDDSMDRAEREMIGSRSRLLALVNDVGAQLAAVDQILGVEHAPLTRIEAIERLIDKRDLAVEAEGVADGKVGWVLKSILANHRYVLLEQIDFLRVISQNEVGTASIMMKARAGAIEAALRAIDSGTELEDHHAMTVLAWRASLRPVDKNDKYDLAIDALASVIDARDGKS